jgi:anthranilate phosphoribosyltransferase
MHHRRLSRRVWPTWVSRSCLRPDFTRRWRALGVFRRQWIVPLAHALRRLGAERALVVHGRDGLDEVTLTTETDVAELDGGRVREYTLTPEDLGFARCELGALQVAGVAAAAAAVRGVLAGERGPRREVAVANAAAALYVAGRCESPRDGVGLAAEALDSGRAQAMLGRLVEWSTRCRQDA